MNQPVLHEGTENLYAKKLYTKFFMKQLPKEMDYFLIPKEDIIYKANPIDRKINIDVLKMFSSIINSLSIRTQHQQLILCIKQIILHYFLLNLKPLFILKILLLDSVLKIFKECFSKVWMLPLKDSKLMMLSLILIMRVS